MHCEMLRILLAYSTMDVKSLVIVVVSYTEAQQTDSTYNYDQLRSRMDFVLGL